MVIYKNILEKVKNLNEYTFSKINEALYQNKYIKNNKQLDAIVNKMLRYYYALNIMLKKKKS